jgi:branched-chain amino acid transport system permease protein
MAATETIQAPASTERWHPSARGWSARLAVLVGLFGAVIYLTATVPQFWADRISLAAIWAIIGLSLNIVLGYVGQVSLGHHGFVGIAAFVAAYYVTEKAGCPVEGCELGAFATGTIIAVISGAVAAGLLGLIALRIKGLYLALITLAYGFMAETSIFEIPALTGGGAGMPAPRPVGFVTDRAFAFLAFGFLALVIFIDWRLIRSKVGRAILSIKNSEAVASSYGINVTAYKVLAFVLSGTFAGLAGALLAFRATNVVSNDFVFSTALLWVLMVVVGGLGNRTGVVIGSAFFALFPFLAVAALGDKENLWGRPLDYYTLMIGAALALLTIIQFPGGIAEQISPITRWLRGQPFSMHPEGHGKHKKAKKSLAGRLGLEKKEEGSGLSAIGAAVAQPPAGQPSGPAASTSKASAATEAETTTELPAAATSDEEKGRRHLAGRLGNKERGHRTEDAKWAATATSPPTRDPLSGVRGPNGGSDGSGRVAPSPDPDRIEVPDVWGNLVKGSGGGRDR